jgi:hypothetical protein
MESDVNDARSGAVHLAYRVFGDGHHDLALIPGTRSAGDSRPASCGGV